MVMKLKKHETVTIRMSPDQQRRYAAIPRKYPVQDIWELGLAAMERIIEKGKSKQSSE